jgi:ketosteroid isomerase-like protein
MSDPSIIQTLLDAFMAKDLPAVMALIADDAVLYDPHYPQQRMVGKAQIERGLTWGLASLKQPGFTVRNLWLAEHSGVVELDTHHVLMGGMKIKFDQVFVFDLREGKITRLQSYVPYSPPGIGGLLSKVTRLAWRIQGKL